MAPPTLTNPAITATVCGLEHSAWTALCTSGDSLVPILSSNPVMIFPGGRIFTASSTPSVYDALRADDFEPWQSYTMSHDEVLPLSRDSAIIYYRVEATREGQTFSAVCSSVWVLESDERGENAAWKMATHQQTLI